MVEDRGRFRKQGTVLRLLIDKAKGQAGNSSLALDLMMFPHSGNDVCLRQNDVALRANDVCLTAQLWYPCSMDLNRRQSRHDLLTDYFQL